jgi:hypothetical protein
MEATTLNSNVQIGMKERICEKRYKSRKIPKELFPY